MEMGCLAEKAGHDGKGAGDVGPTVWGPSGDHGCDLGQGRKLWQVLGTVRQDWSWGEPWSLGRKMYCHCWGTVKHT